MKPTLTLCGKVREDPFPPDPASKRRGVVCPVCNRVEGHPGPHRQYRRTDYLIEAEWEDFACRRQPVNGGMPLHIFDWQG